MWDLGRALKETRLQRQLTQMEVARRSHLSLATIQNLEAGRGNPSWDTLVNLFQILGLKIELQKLALDWPLLIALGCPLLNDSRPAPLPDRERLMATLQFIDFSQHEAEMESREKQAVLSWLWALHDHYFSLWKFVHPQTQKWFLKQKAQASIKLRRLALTQLDYL